MTLTTKDAGELFNQFVRGQIARMFLIRRITPTTDSWSLIYGQTEATPRELSEIADSLGFSLRFELRDKETSHDR